MTFLFCLLLQPALYFVSNPTRYWCFAPVAFIALLMDVLIAHITWPLIAGFPLPGEYTVSATLERLCRDSAHPDRDLFIAIACKINRVCPTHDHIKAVL